MTAVALMAYVAFGVLSPDDKLEPGLAVEVHRHKGGSSLDEIRKKLGDRMRAAVDRVVDFNIGNGPYPGTKISDNFTIRWSGILRVKKEAEYTFTLESDDGSRLTVAGKRVINHDGLHSPSPKDGKIRLKKGDHPILVEYFESTEGASCKLIWQCKGIKKQVIPASAFFHPARGPGQKELDPGVRGLLGRYYHLKRTIGLFKDLGDLPEPKVERVDPQVNFPDTSAEFAKTGLQDEIYARWTGLIRVPRKGRYTFYVTSDDGSRLSINGKRVVDNDGSHGMVEKGGAVELDAGDHEIDLEFFEGNGGAGCILSWEGPSIKKQVIPASVLHHDPEAAKLARAAAEERRKMAEKVRAARRALEEKFKKDSEALKHRTEARLKEVETTFKKRREEERKKLETPDDKGFFPATEEQPHMIGKVEAAFQDGPTVMMTLRKIGGSRDVNAVYLAPKAMTRYFELKRKERKPMAGHVVYVWFKEKTRDMVEWATFCREQDRWKLDKTRADRRGKIEAKLREVDQQRRKEEQKLREEQNRELKALRDRLQQEIRNLVKK